MSVTVASLLVNVPEDWRAVLEPEMSKQYFQHLIKFLNDEYSSQEIFPKQEQIFAAFAACPLANVRVVILGQDPYPTPGNAHGLAFSVEAGVAPPASLKNMFKELTSDPEKQGWEPFTDCVISHLSTNKSHLVFLLWGAQSEKKGSLIARKQDHCVLVTTHPSPLSASKGFLGSRCFSNTNKYLLSTKQIPIAWQLPAALALVAARKML